MTGPLRQLNPLNPRARVNLKITGFDLTTENAQALIQTSVGARRKSANAAIFTLLGQQMPTGAHRSASV
jgi:hypothetical protein